MNKNSKFYVAGALVLIAGFFFLSQKNKTKASIPLNLDEKDDIGVGEKVSIKSDPYKSQLEAFKESLKREGECGEKTLEILTTIKGDSKSILTEAQKILATCKTQKASVEKQLIEEAKKKAAEQKKIEEAEFKRLEELKRKEELEREVRRKEEADRLELNSFLNKISKDIKCHSQVLSRIKHFRGTYRQQLNFAKGVYQMCVEDRKNEELKLEDLRLLKIKEEKERQVLLQQQIESFMNSIKDSPCYASVQRALSSFNGGQGEMLNFVQSTYQTCSLNLHQPIEDPQTIKLPIKTNSGTGGAKGLTSSLTTSLGDLRISEFN